MKILLAVDGSPTTRHMLAYLAARPELVGPANEITVAYGVLPLPNGLTPLLSEEAIRERLEADAQEVFRPVRSFLQMQGIEARYVHEVGDPAKVIARLAEDGRYDMVVIGSHGRGALANMVLGSVVTKVLALCDVPALVVRHRPLSAA